MNDEVIQLTVGGVFAVLVIKEVLHFLSGKLVETLEKLSELIEKQTTLFEIHRVL